MFDNISKGGANCAIDNPVIKREGQVKQLGGNDVPGVVVHRFLDHLPKPEDPDLWMIDDRRRDQTTDVSDTGYRECASAQVVGVQIVPSPL